MFHVKRGARNFYRPLRLVAPPRERHGRSPTIERRSRGSKFLQTAKARCPLRENGTAVLFSFEIKLVAGAVLAVLNAAENEGLAVGALTHSGVLFVCANADLFKSAVALAGVVSALSNGACNAMIVLLFHSNTKPFAKSKIR